MDPENNNDEYLAGEAHAAKLGISLRTFQRESKKPGFPQPIRVGRCCRWSKADVLAFYEPGQHPQEGEADAGTITA
jgi:predicted DNA-binding transcriptional regulator AlpA